MKPVEDMRAALCTMIAIASGIGLALGIISRPLANMDMYKRAVAGESGWVIESIGGTEMFVAYHPVRAPSATWAVFFNAAQ